MPILKLLTTQVNLTKTGLLPTCLPNKGANFFLTYARDLWGGRVVSVIHNQNTHPKATSYLINAKSHDWTTWLCKVVILFFASFIGLFLRLASLYNSDVRLALTHSPKKDHISTELQVRTSSITKSNLPPTPSTKIDSEEVANPAIPSGLLDKEGTLYFYHLFNNREAPELQPFVEVLSSEVKLAELYSQPNMNSFLEHHGHQFNNLQWDIATLSGEYQSFLSDTDFQKFVDVLDTELDSSMNPGETVKDFLTTLLETEDLQSFIESQQHEFKKVMSTAGILSLDRNKVSFLKLTLPEQKFSDIMTIISLYEQVTTKLKHTQLESFIPSEKGLENLKKIHMQKVTQQMMAMFNDPAELEAMQQTMAMFNDPAGLEAMQQTMAMFNDPAGLEAMQQTMAMFNDPAGLEAMQQTMATFNDPVLVSEEVD